MRFNKQELLAIASLPSQNFDKEGVLYFKEKQDGFFRRTEVCVSRWYRLKGNLLFYFRGPEQWSEPVGAIVLENQTVQLERQDESGHWPFQIVFGGGVIKMATLLENDRNALVKCIEKASFGHIKSVLTQLKTNVIKQQKKLLGPDINSYKIQKFISLDLNEVPLCELALSCDNLLCYPYGRAPSAMVVVRVKHSNGKCVEYATTEVVENCSNPSFSKTIMFRANDGLTGNTLVQIAVHDIIEKISQTAVPIGVTNVLLNTIQDTQRLRITLNSNDNKTVGFVTINGWRLEPSSSTNSPKHTNTPNSMHIPQKVLCHKRSHSLPPRLGVKLKLPLHGNIMKYTFANSYQVSYRFHSGLGGDISVHEIMAESKLCFLLPIQLLSLYIQREFESLQEILHIGELNGKWKLRQIELLNTHLYLLKHYSHAIQRMQIYLHSSNGKHFKKSSEKDDPTLEFAPVNLHLQRMWAYNDTLNKCGFHDIITVGAFAAHTHKAGRTGGLLRLVQQMKDVSTKVCMNSPVASRVQMASDAVQAIKQLRKEIFTIMQKLLSLAKVKQSSGMIQLAEEMVTRTRTLLTLWDPGLMEEVLSFIERHKVTTTIHNNVDNAEASSLDTLPPNQLNQHLNLLELCNHNFMPHFLKPENDSLSTLDLSSLFPTTPIDNVDRSFSAMSAVTAPPSFADKDTGLKFHNNHFDVCGEKEVSEHKIKDNSHSSFHNNKVLDIFAEDRPPIMKNKSHQEVLIDDSNTDGENSCEKEADDISAAKYPIKEEFDLNYINNFGFNNWYHGSEEPEPWDLTQLNIEASVMCLVSKVKFLCGRCGSPAVRLRNKKNIEVVSIGNQQLINKQQQSLVQSDEEVRIKNDQSDLMSTLADTDSAVVAAVDSVKNLVKKGNKFTEGLKLDEVNDWSEELQPSMKKLKQTMDGLLKTGRLAHTVLRLKGEHPHKTRALTALQMRRDTCFSQALTALTSGLMCWFWTFREDFIVTLLSAGLGPLCGFEGLLSLHGSESSMWGDMIVAIEDLQTVSFTLTKSNHSTNVTPQITGSRCSLNVQIPVPDSMYAKFKSKEFMTFTTTAVFFNVGINKMASVAETAGDTRPQEQSNTDNFDRLNKYYHKYKKIFPNDPTTIARSSSRIKPLEEIMENLHIIVHKKIAKNVETLHLAALATRYMNGVRITSCKSAKDRTGMSSTLEQCNILASEYHLAEHEFTKALDVMRSEGCRRENTEKNIGIRKYAFTKVQIYSLPKEYRPPPGTYGSTHT